jgi:DNA-binding NtrC family response regulator
MADPRPRILSIGFDITVFDTRNRVLEFAGFDVVACFRGSGAMERLRSERFEAVVIGHSVPDGMRLRLLREVKRLKPQLPVVVIYKAGESGQDLVEADAVCDSLESPELLIKTVSHLIGFSAQSVRPAAARASAAG